MNILHVLVLVLGRKIFQSSGSNVMGCCGFSGSTLCSKNSSKSSRTHGSVCPHYKISFEWKKSWLVPKILKFMAGTFWVLQKLVGSHSSTVQSHFLAVALRHLPIPSSIFCSFYWFTQCWWVLGMGLHGRVIGISQLWVWHSTPWMPVFYSS